MPIGRGGILGIMMLLLAVGAGSPAAIDYKPLDGPSGQMWDFKTDTELACDDGSLETFLIMSQDDWMGNLFALPCDIALLKSVRFTHYGFGVAGPYVYNLHILDEFCAEIASVNDLAAPTTGAAPEEVVVDLEGYEICLEGDFHVMIEPRTCIDSPTNEDCYPRPAVDLWPSWNPDLACSRVRPSAGGCYQFTVSGHYTNFMMRATVECDAPICLGTVDTLTVGSATACPGRWDVEVPVTLVNSIPAGGIEFQVDYDPTLIEAVGILRTPLTEDFEVFGVNLEEGSASLVAIADFVGGGDVPPVPVGSGPIATLVFDVACVEVPEQVTFPLQLTAGAVSDTTGLVDIPTLNVDGSFTVTAGVCPPVGVEERDERTAGLQTLSFPNPTSAGHTFHFALGRPSQVRVEIFDTRGRFVHRAELAELPAGDHTYRWDARDRNGRAVPAGIYLYRVVADGGADHGKIMIVK